MIINPEIAKISLFGEELLPGRGGLIGVLFAPIFIAYTEQFIRRFIPQSLDIIVTPTVSLLITGIVTYVVFMPLGGFISDAITSGLLSILDIGGIAAGFILGATFLPLVVTGLHQGLTPVHMELINSIGDDPLLPILAMGGAGQVGAAFAVFVKTKKTTLRKAIAGGLPSGLLGIGEPLIFGVTFAAWPSVFNSMFRSWNRWCLSSVFSSSHHCDWCLRTAAFLSSPAFANHPVYRWALYFLRGRLFIDLCIRI